MAGNSGKKSSQAAKRTSGTSRTTRTSKSPAASRRSGTTSARARSTRKNTRGYDGGDSFIPREIAVIFLFAVMVFLFLSNFGIMGSVGRFFSRLQFGLFGLQAYVVPVLVFVLALFLYANRDAEGVGSKITAIVLLLLVIGIICELVDAEMIDGMKYSAKEIYLRCAGDKSGGGLIAGSIAFALYSMLKLAGTILVLLVVAVSSLVLLSRRSFLDALSSGARKVGEGARIAHENVRERKRIRREQYEEDYTDAPEEYPPYDDGQDVYSDDYYSPEDAVFEETARERLLRGRRGKISGVEIHT
ncbi:MAG: DNA translocase FtsK 4TM domain-containing protein, partial [Lachnospiraceae bacterium]|nr:DNA translocase FtsK 4TM domain-containing protein [Lachnospiraceae bacterium]